MFLNEVKMAECEWIIGEPGNTKNLGKVGDYWEENSRIYYLYSDYRDLSLLCHFRGNIIMHKA